MIKEKNRERKISSILRDEPFVLYTKNMAIKDLVNEFSQTMSVGINYWNERIPVKHRTKNS